MPFYQVLGYLALLLDLAEKSLLHLVELRPELLRPLLRLQRGLRG